MFEKSGMWRIRFEMDGVERQQDALASNILEAIVMSTSYIVNATRESAEDINITKIELLRD